MLKPGMTFTLTKTVTESCTAKALGSGLLEVLSTPMLIAWMEEASLTIVAPELEEGCSTVGISMDMKHLAATPVGREVFVTATLRDIDRKRLVFEVSAQDGSGLIGTAVHGRFIVNSESFMKKAGAR